MCQTIPTDQKTHKRIIRTVLVLNYTKQARMQIFDNAEEILFKYDFS